ncbi:hypothetical protein [Streptomyces sp. SID3343]|uniref:hypothetical protein n=1 Tax=Streptomyces sp. SID3343 TaxID=2690260 RepID=UPI0013680086|nr:hypothetical protein [Streptomyces sp. SID3343]MYW02248.1 hypothetical protein [Streptomyces sp. SID3343]
MRNPRIRIATVALAASALFFASACDSDSDSDGKDPKSGGTSASSAPSDPPAPGSTGATNSAGSNGAKTPDTSKPSPSGASKASDRLLTKDQLTAALLTQSEMNTGTDYEQNAPDPSVLGGKETAVRPECQPFVDLALPGNGRPAPVASIRAATTAGTTANDPLSTRLDVIELYAFGPGQAESLLAKGRAALATCSTITTTDENGVRSTMVYNRADGPALGDDSLAATGLIEDGGATGALMVRVGSHLVIVSRTDMEGTKAVLPDLGLVRKQITKLETAARA